MARKKKAVLTINRTKPLSNARRYEFLRDQGIPVPTGIGDQHDIVRGQALDDYIDGKVWQELNPGKEPICVF